MQSSEFNEKTNGHNLFRIGDWQLDKGVARLSNISGEHKRLTPKTLQVLLILVEKAGITVSRAELLERVWKSTYPSDYVVSRAIADLRVAFGEDAKSAGYIETVPKLGYRLVADIAPLNPPSAPKQAELTKQPKLKMWLLGAASLFITLFLFLATTDRHRGDSITFPAAVPITSAPGLEQMPRISSDAKSVVYASLGKNDNDWDIYSQSTAGSAPKPVAVSDFVEYGPALSPKNDEIAYVRFKDDQCEVVVQPLFQSKPKVLSLCTTKFHTVVDWSPNSNLIAYTSDSKQSNGIRAIHMVNRSTGITSPLTKGVSRDGTDYYPRFSPSGDKIAFLRGEPKPDHHAHLFIIDLKTKEQRQITTANSFHAGFTWLDENQIMYVVREAGQLVSQVVNLASGDVKVLPLRDVFQPDYNIKNKALSVSKLQNDIDITLLNLTNKKTKFIAESTASDWSGDLSPDGRWLTFVSTRSGASQLWLASVTDSAVRQLTHFENADISAPHWNPDSETILFNVKQGEQRLLFTTNIITGDTNALTVNVESSASARWLSSGQELVFSCKNQSLWQLCQHNIQTSKTKTILAQKAFDPVIAQNDNLVFFTKDKLELWEFDIESGNTRVIWDELPNALGAGWTVLNNVVYYIRSSNQPGIGQLESRDIATGKVKILYRGAISGFNTNIDISEDGNSLVFSSWRSAQDDIVLFQPLDFAR